MEKHKSIRKGRLFKNPILEALTRTTPLLSLIVYLPVVLAFLFIALFVVNLSLLVVFLTFIFAFFFWTFAEYVLHRYLFHWVSESKSVQRIHYLMHGVHHDFPNDSQRLLMPPVPGLLLASVLFGIIYLLFYAIGWSQLSWAFFPGFFFGYLIYSFIHYSIHKFKPPSILKPIWVHHHLHHHKYPDRAFGVSSLVWDRIFGTLPPEHGSGKKTVAK